MMCQWPMFYFSHEQLQASRSKLNIWNTMVRNGPSSYIVCDIAGKQILWKKILFVWEKLIIMLTWKLARTVPCRFVHFFSGIRGGMHSYPFRSTKSQTSLYNAILPFFCLLWYKLYKLLLDIILEFLQFVVLCKLIIRAIKLSKKIILDIYC